MEFCGDEGREAVGDGGKCEAEEFRYQQGLGGLSKEELGEVDGTE